MQIQDYLLLAVILFLVILAVRFLRRQGTGCCGNCASCAKNCPNSCSDLSNNRKKRR